MALFEGLRHVLRALRARGGWTLRDVEEGTGRAVSFRSVQSYESGEVVPPLDRLEILLNFYGVRSLAELEREFAPLRRSASELRELPAVYTAEDLEAQFKGLSPERAAIAAQVLESLRRMEESETAGAAKKPRPKR